MSSDRENLVIESNPQLHGRNSEPHGGLFEWGGMLRPPHQGKEIGEIRIGEEGTKGNAEPEAQCLTQRGRTDLEEERDIFSEEGTRKKAKLVRRKEKIPNLVLGINILIDEAIETTELTLVGRARGKKISVAYLTEWTAKAWKEAPDQGFEAVNLIDGWFMVRFQRKETVQWVLDMN